MVSFKGYDEIISEVYRYKQDHVFSFWNECGDIERKNLLDELSAVDFEGIHSLYTLSGKSEAAVSEYKPAPFVSIAEAVPDREEMKKKGEEHIRQGKCAAFIVAGGQGSRLGYDAPKGAFQVSPVKNKSLFRIHTEKMIKYAEKYGVRIPLLIMTSEMNHAQTLEHFTSNKYFGMDPDDIIFFTQNMIPSLDTNGKLILSSKSSIFKNPDGHGGSLSALRTSGALEKLKKKGIQTISYLQVDNPIVNIIDPCFIGRHLSCGADVSSKIVRKAGPDEKVGVFVQFVNGSDGVMEYSDLPREKIEMRDADGALSYTAANIAIHLFDLAFIERLTLGKDISLPYHVARKKIRQYSAAGFADIDGFKFEKFVFDAIPVAQKSLVVEVVREEEFAPVKNASGVDSLATSQELMDKLHRGWLAERGITVPPQADIVEISPLAAVDPEDLDASLVIPAEEKVYIG